MKIVVIGAGPGGALSAILCARAGFDTVLIEQSRFPRDKVCGECVSALGRSVLRRHNLEQPILDAGAVDLTHAKLFAGQTDLTLNLPEPMLGISRRTLDRIMLDIAQHEGVTVRQPWRAESVRHAAGDDEPVDAVMRSLNTNEVRHERADYVLVADGRSNFFGDKPQTTGDMGIKAHFRNIRADAGTITLFAAKGCYGGVAPIEEGLWNAAFTVKADSLKAERGDVGRLFAKIIRDNESALKTMAGATQACEWLTAPLPRFAVRDDWLSKIIPVGNAACAIEPIGGEGMGLALRSAELAVDAMISGTAKELPRRYRQLWNKRRTFCRSAAVVFTHPTLADHAVRLLSQADVPTRSLMSLVGK